MKYAALALLLLAACNGAGKAGGETLVLTVDGLD